VFQSQSGPWGKLRSFYIYLEAPRTLVDDYPMPSAKPRWSFPESTASQLPQFFKDVGLSESFREALSDATSQTRVGGNIHLFPPVAELEAMTPAQREVIYAELRRFPENEYHVEPVHITTDTVDEWFKTSKLRPELIGKIRQMSYRLGDCIAFSDVSAVLSYASSEAEARLLLQAVTRTRSLMVQLELPKGTELEPLAEYWTAGDAPRLKDVRPLMQAILDTNGAERLELSHLLPALPRRLLYTYPGPEFSREGLRPDCHWSALNFFHYTAQNELLDPGVVKKTVHEDFSPIEPPYRYGDVLFYVNTENGSGLHSCVYLADDMVFTKNGRNTYQPWVVLKLADVNKIYLHDKTSRIQGYRPRELPGQ
jgi:hypothetical protein